MSWRIGSERDGVGGEGTGARGCRQALLLSFVFDMWWGPRVRDLKAATVTASVTFEHGAA